MRKDREIQQLDNYLGNFSKEIQKRIDKQGEVKILDAGCGYGLVMAGLIKKFGDKIGLIGYNQKREHGTIKNFKEKAVKRGIFTEEEFKEIKKLPKIIYLDADKRLPFKKDSFDFVYSLASVYLYKDKVKFFEECNRILRKNGLARIHLFELKRGNVTPKQLNKTDISSYLKIEDNGKTINSIKYLKSIKGVKIRLGRREDNNHTIVYLQINKQPKLNFRLKLIKSIKGELDGIKSIYTIK